MTRTVTFAGTWAAAIMAATGAMAQDVTLRMHQFLPAQANVPAKILDVWADRVEQSSGGRIEIERYASMALGGAPPELIDQAIDGVADIVWTVVGYTPNRFPTTEVFELPFMVENTRDASCAFWKMYETEMRDEFADVHIVGTWVHGPGVIHSADPVETPEDLQGMKVRGGSRLVNQLLDRAGASPVGMPVPAVPEGLSKGVIDATTIPWEVTTALKVPELVANHTEFEGNALYTLAFILAMNNDAYNNLPDDLQKAIDDNSGLEFSIFAGDVMAVEDGPARDLALELGNEIITIGRDAAQADWLPLVEPIYDEWTAEMTEDGRDGEALVQKARDLMSGDCAGVAVSY